MSSICASICAKHLCKHYKHNLHFCYENCKVQGLIDLYASRKGIWKITLVNLSIECLYNPAIYHIHLLVVGRNLASLLCQIFMQDKQAKPLAKPSLFSMSIIAGTRHNKLWEHYWGLEIFFTFHCRYQPFTVGIQT